jgi:hypothetical protein
VLKSFLLLTTAGWHVCNLTPTQVSYVIQFSSAVGFNDFKMFAVMQPHCYPEAEQDICDPLTIEPNFALALIMGAL